MIQDCMTPEQTRAFLTEKGKIDDWTFVECCESFLVHLIGQSNACGRAALPAPYTNTTGLTLEGATLTPTTPTSDVVDSYGAEMVMMECLSSECPSNVIKTCLGGITAVEYLQDQMPIHLPKVAAAPTDECTSQAVLWIQGERDARIQNANYQADEAAVFDALIAAVPGIHIYSLLLGDFQTNLTAASRTLINDAKLANEAAYSQVTTIPNAFPVSADELHYDQAGLDGIGRAFVQAVTGEVK